MSNTESAINSIRVNQLGYGTHLPKYAAVLEAKPLALFDSEDRQVAGYEVPELSFDEASGDNVYVIDLGDIPSGTYTLKNSDSSATVNVSDKPFTTLVNSLIKGLYYQRCGCALEAKHAGIFTHKACHTAPSIDWEDRSKTKTITGGWHDAGDYGKYVSPGAVTVAHLLYSYLLFGTGCSDDLNIPETGNGTPDILNEARFELDWILRMQREDGAFYHKLTKDHFAPFIMPEDDTDPEYIVPPSHTATADAVAVLALASRTYREFDPAFSDRALDAAVKGYKWLVDNQDFSPYINPHGLNTGPYTDTRVIDELFWACCELYLVTGEGSYIEEAERLYNFAKDVDSVPEEDMIFRQMMIKQEEAVMYINKKYPFFHTPKLSGLDIAEFGWSNVAGLGGLCCLLFLKKKAGEAFYNELREDLLKRSKDILQRVNNSGYRTALRVEDYVWGSIINVMNNAMAMVVNYLLTGREDMLSGALSQIDYSLGLNALDLSFVTGLGSRSVQNPHHRPSGADGIDAPVPGFIVGGPNKRFTYPFTKEKLGETPAAKYYLDETPSADTNEIAIYWNSPAIFVAAFFNTL
ncbi:MAG: glycoside hydrolase family 9 protein [Lachnospiraceae bacterium]|nr:glycoside hydrolase family 9 protein [Lachnospiraceae bacterium]